MVATREEQLKSKPCADTTVHRRHPYGWKMVCEGITVEEYGASQAAREEEDEALTGLVTEMARLAHEEELAVRINDEVAYGLPLEEALTWDVLSQQARDHKVLAMRKVLRYAMENVGRNPQGRWKESRIEETVTVTPRQAIQDTDPEVEAGRRSLAAGAGWQP